MDTYETNSKKKLIATFVAVILIAGVVVLIDQLKSKDATVATTTSLQPANNTAATTPDTTSTTDSTTAITDSSTATSSSSSATGTYSATASYSVPHGNETIAVNVALSDGTITDVSIQNSEGDHDSIAYQEDFTDSYKSAVVGKKISGLQLSTIAGASDTTEGFNDAISQIASKAQA